MLASGLAVVVLSAAGVLGARVAADADGPGAPVVSGTAAPSAPAAGAAVPDTARVTPLALRIPSIGVDVPLIELGTDAAGVLVPPDSFDVAGWFAGGPVPGDTGPALIAGHVDSKAGPAVFYSLRDLVGGATVEVDRSDGRVARFSVVSVQSFPKDQFPTAQVYGPTPVAELRLVTCGGVFDRAAGSYLDNVVVRAVAEPGGWG